MEETEIHGEAVRVSDQLLQLHTRFDHDQGFQACVDSLRNGQPATFESVWGSSCALLLAALAKSFAHVLVITADGKTQDRLMDDLPTFYDGPSDRLAACITNNESNVSVDLEYGERLRLIKSMNKGDASPITIASVASLLQPLPSKDDVAGHSRTITVGQTLDIESLVAWLTEQGFHHTSAVELPGEFSNRGGILDVFAPDWGGPIRVELFDDEVESLRQFDPGTQLSLADVSQVEITVLDPDVSHSGFFAEYLPAETIVLLLQPDVLAEHAQRYLQRSPDSETIFTWDQVRQSLAEFPMATAAEMSAGYTGSRFNLPVETVEAFSGDVGEVKMQVDRLARDASGTEFDVFVLASVAGEIPRVTEILKPTGATANSRLHIGVGCIHEGFRIRDTAQVIVGCDQVFRRTDLRRKSRRRLGKAIDSFMDLRVGDLIVHLSHGIGRFRGLKMLEKDAQLTEHLELEFYGGTKLYVPASKIDLVQKYIGGTKRQPVLAKIGNKSWAKQKNAVQDAITDLAAEMIDLQAKRELQPGMACGPDPAWQHAFEQSFPYHETPDQLTAIEAIKEDMERERPMDRLLCGDVGFGKTEVAMRAAFKAVENGFQVGVLVPTTVLAEQHYKSFRQRMAEFPVEIAKLSRFCTPAEMRQTLEKMKTGEVDIAIGTHRIVSKDVQFKNLGLVIIDEEQRFGVQHKERLKNLRSSVDVLTLSATPIPRTLHMSLVGVRDISNLETPPEDLTPVETKVSRYNNSLIKPAILRELNRGGQIFFVHNRVKDIQRVQQRLN